MPTQSQLFGIRSLNGKVERFGNSMDKVDVNRAMPFQRLFAMGREVVARDGTAEWDEVPFSRSLAPVVGHDSPFPLRKELDRINVKESVMHVKESKLLDPRRLYDTRFPGQLLDNAPAYVEQEMKDLVNRISQTIEYACAKTLEGSLAVSSANIAGSELTFTKTYSVNTYTASASWATAGTKILSSELKALKQDFQQTCGMAPAQAIGGADVEAYFTGNTEVSNFLENTIGDRIVETAGQMEGPLFGGLRIGNMSWTITEGGYVPDGGSFTRYITAVDNAIVLPADGMLPDVLGMALGRGFVPAADLAPAEQAHELIRPAPGLGWYSYATRESNPASVRIYVGWTGLPVLLDPTAVQFCDLIP